MEFIKRLIGHELVSGSFYIFLGSIAANVLAFLLNLFLARNLSYVDYGIFASLLSIITLASIPSSAINNVIVKFATSYLSKGEIDKVSSLYLYALKIIVVVCLLIVFGFILTSSFLLSFLHLNDPNYILLTGITVASFYLFSLNNAFLQSLMKFAFMALAGTVGGLIKLIVGIVLVYAGYRVYGGLLSIFFMTIGIFIISFIPLREILRESFDKKIKMPTREILNYSLPTIVTGIFLISFTTTDVILVKHFFNAHDAGFYAGLSLIGKVIFYFTAPIPMVMFPLLVKRHATGKRFNNLFYLALILVILPSLFITAFYFLFPDFVIKFFLGGRDYLGVAAYLGLFGLYLTIFSLINVCVNFFLSVNKTNIAIFVVGASILQIVLIFFYHDNFYQVIWASMLACILLLIFLLSYFFKNFVVQSKPSG